MKKIVSVFLMAAFIAGSPMAKAGSESKDEKLTVSVKEVPPTPEEIYGEAFNPIRDDSFNPADVGSYVDIGELIMIGNALINIIKAGEPVVNIKTDVIHVVPAGIADWRGLSNWHAGPAFKIYNVQVTSKIRGVVVYCQPSDGTHKSRSEMECGFGCLVGSGNSYQYRIGRKPNGGHSVCDEV